MNFIEWLKGAFDWQTHDGVDLGVQTRILESGINYNETYIPTTAIDKSTYPRLKLEADRTSSTENIYKVVFEYR